jgi:malate synthase
MEAFNEHMGGDNQLSVKRDDVHVTADDLLAVPEGAITEKGLRTNISVGIQYVASWLGGSGAVPINNLMEDAATAEISRAQIWQWIRNPKGVLSDGRKVTLALYCQILGEELANIKETVGDKAYADGNYDTAAQIFTELTENDEFAPFLTIGAYELLK